MLATALGGQLPTATMTTSPIYKVQTAQWSKKEDMTLPQGANSDLQGLIQVHSREASLWCLSKETDYKWQS